MEYVADLFWFVVIAAGAVGVLAIALAILVQFAKWWEVYGFRMFMAIIVLLSTAGLVYTSGVAFLYLLWMFLIWAFGLSVVVALFNRFASGFQQNRAPHQHGDLGGTTTHTRARTTTPKA